MVFKFEFYYLRSYGTKVAPLFVIGATLLQMCQKLLAPFSKFVTGGQGPWQPSGKLYLQPSEKYLRGYCANFANSSDFV
jgi:hypothetical protein